MNFFGHVVVATWQSAGAAVALGSMLPDFASMCRGRLVRAHDPDVAAGVELHHRTDAAFHRLESFSQLEHQVSARLTARGVRRGGALGTAHVAVELLLDGALVGDADARALYLCALEHAEELGRAAEPRIEWAAPDQAERWQALHTRLRLHGVPEDYGDAGVVGRRVGQILARYETLALNERELAIVTDEMEPLRRRVVAEAPAIMAGLRQALAQP